MMKRLYRTYVPFPIRQILRKSLRKSYKTLHDSLYDGIDSLLGSRAEMMPPRRMIFVGDGDFKKIGEKFRDHFIELGKLQPDEKILDVGCGIGRMAIPLTRYLSPQGEYHGFDIVKKGVDWCSRHISPKFPNFRFRHADVFNKHYNVRGQYQACDYRFPFSDNYFDFVFLTSVFTHMLPRDLENYLSEISRVLKSQGRCLITYFLLNPESINLIRSGLSMQAFVGEAEDYFTVTKSDPEGAIAHREDRIRTLYAKYKFRIMEPIHYGSWCGRNNFMIYQDIMLAIKE